MTDLSALAITRVLERLRAGVGCPLTVRAVTGSTNDDARAAAAAGAPHGSVFVADAQTRGRGRGGHAWHSPPGENVYLSLVARPRVPAALVAPIALAAGAAVAGVVEAKLAGRAPAWIKWPNDVLAGEPAAGEAPIHAAKKLAGVLVEGQLRGSEVACVIIGVGVNVRAALFPPEIAARATSLAILGLPPEELDRSRIAAELIAALGTAVKRYEEDGLTSFLGDLARLDALRGARVEVGGARGVADGIDGEGRLLVRGDEGLVRPVATGEVALA